MAKLTLLKEMQDAKIWLVDASVTALYRSGEGRLINGPASERLLRACWEAHIGPLVTSCSPSAILIVGKGVCRAIVNLVKQAAVTGEKARRVVVAAEHPACGRDDIEERVVARAKLARSGRWSIGVSLAQ